MKQTLLARLRNNGWGYLVGAILLVVVIPLYQAFFLQPPPEAIGTSETAQRLYLVWLGSHSLLFIGSQVLFLIAMLLFFNMPFTLFRIVIAQELLTPVDGEDEAPFNLPAEPWKGRGILVLAAWAGILAFVAILLGIIGRAIYFPIVTQGFTFTSPIPGHLSGTNAFFSWLIETAGYGLLALSFLFFGFTIARQGSRLWPLVWQILAYAAMLVALCLAVSAVSNAFHAGNNIFITFATFALGLWHAFLAILLLLLRAE